MHWQINSFNCSLWYIPGVLRFEGALCDCDAWERHQLMPPRERTCPHIRLIKSYMGTNQELGHPEDQLGEDNIRLHATERVPTPPAAVGSPKELRG